jgi:hypothetical protein
VERSARRRAALEARYAPALGASTASRGATGGRLG